MIVWFVVWVSKLSISTWILKRWSSFPTKNGNPACDQSKVGYQLPFHHHLHFWSYVLRRLAPTKCFCRENYPPELETEKVDRWAKTFARTAHSRGSRPRINVWRSPMIIAFFIHPSVRPAGLGRSDLCCGAPVVIDSRRNHVAISIQDRRWWWWWPMIMNNGDDIH